MTALAGGAGDDTRTQPLAAAPASRDVPKQCDGTLLLGRQQGSGYVVPPSLVRRRDGQVLQLTPLLYAVLEAIDGRRSLDEVAAAASESSGRLLAGDDAAMLIDRTLRPLGLVARADGSEPVLRRANPLLRLRPRFVVSDPERTRRVTAPFALLFQPVLVVAATVAFAVVAFWVLFDKGLASAAAEAFRRPGLLLAVFAITVVSAGFHEFGHAAALRRGGGTPGAMGAGLYLIWPAFYTDVTDSYRLGRGARIRTDLGGLYFNALVSLAMFGAWLATRWDGLLLVIAAQILQMVRQLPPLIRFDGYHLLADITGVPDLFHRIGPTLRSFLPRRWRRPESRELRRWVRVVVTLWVVIVVPILLVSVTLTVVALPRILATSWHSIAVTAAQLRTRAGAGDVPGVLVKTLAILALAVPVGGMLYMLVRFVRRILVSTWRRTAGSPAKRALAGLVTAVVVAGLALAWWPHGNYRPIEPYERGTVQDALPATLTAQSTGLHAGRESHARTVWAAGDETRLPTADHPVLAVVLSPRSGSGPTWVFPFDKPAAPGPGDNQSLAVVTRDGGTAYDAAFALVWADGPTALNRNEAYAFASCRGCRAVAVSFQVVLVLGPTHVVAPQNISAAVSYRCVSCVTESLALQLVLSLPAPPDAATLARLDSLWRQVVALGGRLPDLSFADIQATLRSYETQIATLLRPDLTSPPASASPSPTTTGSPAAGGGTDAGTGATGAPTGDPSVSGDGSPAPATAPTTAPATSAPAPTGDASEPAGTAPASAAPSATAAAATG